MIACTEQRILAARTAPGRTADITLARSAQIAALPSETLLQADTAYRGLRTDHLLVETPTPHPRSPRGETRTRELTEAQKRENRRIASERVQVEHVICRLKRFEIIKGLFRRRDLRFAHALSIVVGLVNLSLGAPF